MALLVCSGIFAASRLDAASVDSKHDRFASKTVIRSPSLSVISARSRCSRPAVLWIAHVPDSASGRAIFGFETVASCSDGWRYLSCNTVAMLADGKPVALGEQDRSGDVTSGASVIEFVSVEMDRIALAAAAGATKIELQQCGDEWTLGATEMTELRSFAAEVYRLRPDLRAP